MGIANQRSWAKICDPRLIRDTLSNVFCDDLNPLIVIESPIHSLNRSIRNLVDLRIRPI
ncbi:hypothetical protein RB5903 [Rhodopirellula baltica SH 1]|uniref:Uncharacterized protein n=1 Tax=Rhodopirellula baltica (strain DSM 10527 / NCIMB 13988 / SH1) TaxID=243090 RepID=Q7UR41_RHOBA|nr:hypothetical protein RB5903 [Rhodopirellula baltica SH 1]